MTDEKLVCPKCSGTDFDQGYGLAGGGIGPYTYCTFCFTVVSKVDEGGKDAVAEESKVGKRSPQDD